MDEPVHNGSAAVITAALGRLETKVDAISTETSALRLFAARTEERERGWATKHEVTAVTHRFELALAPVAAQANAAHVRLDTFADGLSVLSRQFGTMQDAVEEIRDKLNVERAEVRGAWKVLKPSLAWVAGISAAVVGAFLIGRLT